MSEVGEEKLRGDEVVFYLPDDLRERLERSDPPLTVMETVGVIERELPVTENDPWAIVEMGCELCTHEWIAVFPVRTEELECPNCEKVNAVWEDEDEEEEA